MNKLTKSYTRIEPLAAILLFCGAAFALFISNSGLNDDYLKYINIPISITIGKFSLSMPLIKWINDGLMSLFFLVLTLEAKFHILEKEFLDKSYLPLAVVSAIGGAIFPAFLYFLVTSSYPILTKGWAIPIATDTAFVLGIISFFSNKIPNNVRIFILSLSIIDDVIAVLVLAIFYTPALHVIPLLAAICFIIALSILNFLNVRMLFPYILIGIGLWLALIEAGVHGTLAGVLLGLMVPLHINSHKKVSYSPLKILEARLRPLVEFVVLPLFAFFNVHISFKAITYADFSSLLILGITIGLFLGKPIGIIVSSYACIKLKLFKLPKSFNWSTFFAVSALCGIGFTFSLFIGLLSFEDSYLIHQMKIGVLIGSLLSGGLGVILLYFVPNRHHK